MDTKFYNINQPTPLLEQNRLINDQCYLRQRVLQNKNESDYRVTNHRDHQCRKGVKDFTTFYYLYDNQGVEDGHVGKCTVQQDNLNLRYGNLTPRPIDRLAESVPIEWKYNYLDINTVPITNVDHEVSTSLSVKPQRGYNPIFNREGIDTRNYKRKTERYYKYSQPQKYARQYVKTLGSSGRFSPMK